MLYMHHHETSGHPVIDIAPVFWSTLAVLWVSAGRSAHPHPPVKQLVKNRLRNR